jgi:hypothetical protein
VIGPTFHFDVPRLDFGVISYGMSSVQLNFISDIDIERRIT